LQFCSVLQKTIPKPAPPLGTIFAGKILVFSIHFYSLQQLQNKKQKTKKNIGRVGFEGFAVFFAVALQCLCSFMPAC